MDICQSGFGTKADVQHATENYRADDEGNMKFLYFSLLMGLESSAGDPPTITCGDAGRQGASSALT